MSHDTVTIDSRTSQQVCEAQPRPMDCKVLAGRNYGPAVIQIGPDEADSDTTANVDYEREADALFDVLLDNLPSGTLDRLILRAMECRLTSLETGRRAGAVSEIGHLTGAIAGFKHAIEQRGDDSSKRP